MINAPTHTTAWASINKATRDVQLQCVNAHLMASGFPFIAAGDLNAPPDSEEIARFLNRNVLQLTGDPKSPTHRLIEQRLDYILADRFVIPEERRGDYSENVVWLPDCFQVNDATRKISPHAPSRAAAALPAQGFVYCCFNNTWKLTPEVFDLWMRILGQVEGSVLWLLQSHGPVTDNLRREAEQSFQELSGWVRELVAKRRAHPPRVADAAANLRAKAGMLGAHLPGNQLDAVPLLASIGAAQQEADRPDLLRNLRFPQLEFKIFPFAGVPKRLQERAVPVRPVLDAVESDGRLTELPISGIELGACRSHLAPGLLEFSVDVANRLPRGNGHRQDVGNFAVKMLPVPLALFLQRLSQSFTVEACLEFHLRGCHRVVVFPLLDLRGGTHSHHRLAAEAQGPRIQGNIHVAFLIGLHNHRGLIAEMMADERDLRLPA